MEEGREFLLYRIKGRFWSQSSIREARYQARVRDRADLGEPGVGAPGLWQDGERRGWGDPLLAGDRISTLQGSPA